MNIAQDIVKVIENNREDEVFCKAFLRPMEIALKTHSTQHDRTKIGCMPYGLKQACKASILDNKYSLTNFLSIDEAINSGILRGQQKRQKAEELFEKIKSSYSDNLISLMKTNDDDNPALKIAICVCMYSEEASMLRKTLIGIMKNIQILVKNGVSYNQIAVFVIMDGIEAVNQNIQEIFDQFEKKSNIYFSGGVKVTNPRDLLRENRQIQQDQIDDINHFIFSGEQFQQRKKCRFTQRKSEYMQYKKMIQQVRKLQKLKNLTYYGLDPTVQKFFIEKARQQWKSDYAVHDDDLAQVREQNLLQAYAKNIETSRPIINQALNEAKKYCYQYFATREKLALLYSFRVPIGRTKRHTHIQFINEQQQNDKDEMKMNLFLTIKYKNKGKLSSHNWFFNGFCQQLKPKYAILLDVGLVPHQQALFKMYKYMEDNANVGGVCGYMGLRVQKLDQKQKATERESIDCLTSFCLNFVDIQRAQQFQYHYAHLIDKPFQSLFGFIHVLPGAFSGYRMQALRPQGKKDSLLLKDYFKSIDQATAQIQYRSYDLKWYQGLLKVILPTFIYQMDCLFGKPANDSYEKLLCERNVFLAQDRTLCVGIHNNGYDLVFLPDATSQVDPIKTLQGLLGQRKRWINGSWFAFDQTKQKLSQLDKSFKQPQQAGRKGKYQFFLKWQNFFLTFFNVLVFIAPGIFIYTVHLALQVFQKNVIFQALSGMKMIDKSPTEIANNKVSGIFVYALDTINIMIFFGLVLYSLHINNRHKRFKGFYYGVCTIYGLFSLCIFGVLVYDLVTGFFGKKQLFFNNSAFTSQIPGGYVMVQTLRYIIFAILGLYMIPVVLYMLFGSCEHLKDIVFGFLSFIFYSQTYLNILNIYALCRMDDISWGTKGLNEDSQTSNQQMMKQWKKIKFLNVSKFVFYNILIAFILLFFGQGTVTSSFGYVEKFWLSFIVMVILGVTLLVKVFFCSIYLIKYICCKRVKSTQNSNQQLVRDQILSKFQEVKQSMYKEVRKSIEQVEGELKAKNMSFPFRNLNNASKICKEFKFGKQSKLKKALVSKNQQRFSSIHKKNLQRIRGRQKQEKKNKNKQRLSTEQKIDQKLGIQRREDSINIYATENEENLEDSRYKTLIYNKGHEYVIPEERKKKKQPHILA